MENHINTAPLPPAPLPEPNINSSGSEEDNGPDPHAVHVTGHVTGATRYRETYLDQMEAKPPRLKSLELRSDLGKGSGKMGDADLRMPLTAAGLWESLFSPFRGRIARFLRAVQDSYTLLILRDLNPALDPDNTETTVEKFVANFIRQARKSWEIFLEGLPSGGHLSSHKGPVLLVPASSLEVMMENIYFTDIWRQLANLADESTTSYLSGTSEDSSAGFRTTFLSADIKNRITAIVMREVCSVALGNDTSYVLEDYFAVDTTADMLSRVTDSVRREAGQMLSIMASVHDLQLTFDVLQTLSYGRTVDLSGLRMEGEWPLVVSLLRRYGDEGKDVVRAAIGADPNLLLQECPLLPPDVATCVTRPSVLEICVVQASDVISGQHADMILDCCFSRVLNQPIRGLFSENLGCEEGTLPLTLAAIYQGQRKVRALLRLGASVFSMDKNGTLLHNLIKLLCLYGNEDKKKKKQRELSNIISLVLHGHMEESDIEVESQSEADKFTYQRALVSAISPEGFTPIEDSVRYQRPDVLTDLMTLEHVTSRTVVSNARQSIRLIDMTEFERNAFLLAEVKGSQAQHKSCRSRFAGDLIYTSLDPANTDAPLIQQYTKVKFRQNFRYYVTWAALHFIMMLTLTATCLTFPRPWPVLPPGGNVSNDSGAARPGSSSHPAVLAGESLLCVYALSLLAWEMYDSVRYTNCRAELRYIGSAISSMLHYYRSDPIAVHRNSYTLHTQFRIGILLFALCTTSALTLRLFGYPSVLAPYGVSLVLGWAVMAFLFGVCRMSVLFVHLFPTFVKFVLLVVCLVLGYAASVFICHTQSSVTFDEVVYDIIVPLPFTGDNTLGVHYSAYVYVMEIIFKLSLCLLLTAFVASVVQQTALLTQNMDALWRGYVCRILLLIERRLPHVLRRRDYIEIDGKYYLLITFDQTGSDVIEEAPLVDTGEDLEIPFDL